MAQVSSEKQEPLLDTSSEQKQQSQSEQKEESQSQQSQTDNSAEAIKFIKDNFETAFDEQNAKTLFEYYTLDPNASQSLRLEPPDVRKLLLDILCASEWPLVVPDESLDAVLRELCLNDEGSISWIEFKSFFVFLQDRPLLKLFEIITKLFSQKQILYSRIISIKPVTVNSVNREMSEQKNESNSEINPQMSEQNYYDRKKWKSAVQNLIPEATSIFVYFMDGYQILALALGDFDQILAETACAELRLDDCLYLATIRAFDAVNDVFPPIARSGGMKSKVARKIADSYLIAREWDQKHFALVDKAAAAVHSVSVKWTEFDSKYRVNERVNATATSVFASVRAFDEKHQLTRRLSNNAKQLNEKFGITDKLGSVADKISANEKVQSVSNKVNESFKAAVKTIDDIGQETQQLVQEKRQQGQGQGDEDGAGDENVQDGDGQIEQQNEGDVAPV